jgi:hypothetical protein
MVLPEMQLGGPLTVQIVCHDIEPIYYPLHLFYIEVLHVPVRRWYSNRQAIFVTARAQSISEILQK